MARKDLHKSLLEIHDTNSKNKYPKSTFFIIHTEFCNGGSLQDWLLGSLNNKLPKRHYRSRENAEQFFAQILEGVAFLFQKEIVHGDLKPPNIFLHHTKSGTVLKIGDFGGAFVASGQERREIHWTPLYADVEVYTYLPT